MKFLYIDLETRSRTDLKKFGVYRYTEDPDFSILMAGWAIDDSPVQVAVGHDEILAIPGLLDPDVLHVAHNAQFERVSLGVLAECLQDPEQWLDTAALAAEYGYPVSLEAAAKALGAAPKDAAGSRLIKLFCLPNKDGSWNTAEIYPMEWLDFIAYCEQDVETMIELHQRLGDWPTDTERRVWIADQRINDRGMRIDLELCRVAAWQVAENKETDKEEFTNLTDVDNPGSVQQVMVWAKEAGLDLPNLRAETIEAAIEDPDTDPVHVRVLELRQDLALAAGGKFSAALDVVSPDDRIRGGFRFFGAHTGRWTGQRVQPQNLPRATVDEPEAAILDLKLGLGAEPNTLKALVRSMFIGPLTVVDYASIEARVLAWIANEEWALEAFRNGRDIYVETACIAEGERVLTDRGLVPIEEVLTSDSVWDGVEWVQHKGVVLNGERKVINYDGLRATTDHFVWLEGEREPVPLARAAGDGARLTRSGSGREPLRVDECRIPGTKAPERGVSPACGVQNMRSNVVALALQPEASEAWERLQELPGETLPRVADEESYRRPREKQSGFGRLHPRGVPVREFRRDGRVPMGESTKPGLDHGAGPDRYSGTLREGERAPGAPVVEPEEQDRNSSYGVGPAVLAVLRRVRSAASDRWDVSGRGYLPGGGDSEEQRTLLDDDEAPVRVYDILDAGPRSRFTVSGRLVHNCRMSTPSTPLTRFQGKVATLALGYNGGVNSLRAMGAEGDNDTLQRLVNVWRRANPRIVKLWETMQNAVDSGGRVGPHIRITRRGKDMKMHLPSGRAICYHEVSWDRYVVIDPVSGKKIFKEGWRYADPKRGGSRIGTYGGRLVENATQAIARDVLAEALVRLDEAGYPVVGHVHDEVIVESEQLDEITRLMTQTPTWGRGLPLDGEGFTCERYRKG